MYLGFLAAILFSLPLVDLSKSDDVDFPVSLRRSKFPELKNWNLALPFPAVEVYEARIENSSACVLATENICFAFNFQLNGSYEILAFGKWYSPFRNIDLSRFNISLPLCGWNVPDARFLFQWRRTGMFDTYTSVEAYMQGPLQSNRGNLWKATEFISSPLVIVSPRDAHVGHFIEGVHNLAEVARHLSNVESEDVLLFFSSHHGIGNWSTELARVIFGPNLKIASRGNHYDTCFSRVIFPMNIKSEPSTVNWLRERSYQYVNIENTIPKWQITLVQRQKSRFLINIHEVAKALLTRFPTFPIEIVEFEGKSFNEQVEIMHRTLLYVTSHGASMSNLIFLHKNTTIIEIMPFKFSYVEYERIAHMVGVNHYFFENKNQSLSVYRGNCYKLGGFDTLTELQCFSQFKCRRCVRDVKKISIPIKEFSEFLVKLVIS